MNIDRRTPPAHQPRTTSQVRPAPKEPSIRYKHMSPALIEQIVHMRTELRMSIAAVARKVGYSESSVRARLVEQGIDTKRRDKLTDNERRRAVALYRSGETCQEIAGPLGVTSGAIEYWLKKAGQDRRTPADWLRKYSLNEHAFDVLSPEALYWLGFIYADGCIVNTPRKQCVRVEVQWRDREHLDRLLGFVGSNMQYYASERRGKRYGTIVLNSRRLVSVLLGCGIHPRKTFRSCKLQEALATSRHFWRGMVDGDGSLTYQPDRNAFRMYLLANTEEILQFQAYVLRLAPWFRGNPSRRDGIYRLPVIGYAAAAVLEELYRGDGPALPRKAEAAQAIVARFKGKDRHDRSRIAWPPVENLAEEVSQTSLAAVGMRLGVSYVAVRQHLRKLGAYARSVGHEPMTG